MVSIIISNVDNVQYIIQLLNSRYAQGTLNNRLLRDIPIYIYDKSYRSNMLIYRTLDFGYNQFSMRRTCTKLDHKYRISIEQFVRTYILTNNQFIDMLLSDERSMVTFKSNITSIVQTLSERGFIRKNVIDQDMSNLIDELDE